MGDPYRAIDGLGGWSVEDARTGETLAAFYGELQKRHAELFAELLNQRWREED